MDVIQAIINQVKGTEYRPNAAFVFIKVNKNTNNCAIILKKFYNFATINIVIVVTIL